MRCQETCRKLNVACPVEECKYWISYPEENNCLHVAVAENGSMTLREVADRLGISYVRVKQIQDQALKKIGHLLKNVSI